MKFLYSDEPIIACSTSQHGHAAMAVLRISGFKSPSDFSQFFTLKLENLKARHVYYTTLSFKGERYDDICLTYFEGPKSYNGENILELSIHGNTLNVERILNLFVEHGGCRLAEPGEFTYRALKNKKVSLSQVEGLDLFLNANSGYALNQGLSLLSGNLHEIYLKLWELFLIHKSSLELSIDFSEDIGEEAASNYYHSSLKNFENLFETLLKRVAPQDNNLLQPEIVIAGLPNAGKSSLFNYLLANDRAIVSSVAGTTRDYLSETLQIEAVKYKLVDTAGIRESQDQIEAEGIKRTHKKMAESFFSILLINPLETKDDLKTLLKQKFDLILFTHADHPQFKSAQENLIQKFPEIGSMGAIDLINLDRRWEKNLYQLINEKYLNLVKDQPILLDRHKLLILQTAKALQNYSAIAASEHDVAILSSELNTLGNCISELIGIVSPEQILNSIFENFCIGK